MRDKILKKGDTDRMDKEPSVLYDAGSVCCRLGISKREVNVTFPPLPLSFQGTFDLMPFLAYKSIIIDIDSKHYLFEEPAISSESKTLLGLLEGKGKIRLVDYAKELESHKAEIQNKCIEVYEELKKDAYEKKSESLYYQSKIKWRKFIEELDARPRKSQLLLDNTAAVERNLERIKKGKSGWIVRDYRFLKENLGDVCAVYKLSQIMNLPIHVWDDWSIYYRYIMQKYDTERTFEGEDKVELAHSLWKLYLPDIRLEKIGIDEFMRLLETDAVGLLQNFIQDSRLKPEEVDQKFYIETQKAITNMYGKAERFRSLSSFGWALAGAVGSAFGGPFASLGAIAGEKATQKVIFTIYKAKEKKKFPWKIALEDIGTYLTKNDILTITKYEEDLRSK